MEDSINKCELLKSYTPARICVGRAGSRFNTATLLKFRADHAVAQDAVWSEVDETVVDRLHFKKVKSLVKDKEEYITRPDLGRKLSEEDLELLKESCVMNPQVQIIAGDGLSSPAIEANLEDIYSILKDGLGEMGYSMGTPIYVKYARVAVMDKISEALNAEVTLILIGERPGLATGESMSCYMAYRSSSKKPESQRTVISNIHRGGTPPVEAGAQILQLIETMLKLKKSGVDLKI